MNEKKKLELLEEMFEMDENTLSGEMILDDIDEWDSVAALSLIVLLDENFRREISGKQIKELKTIADILAIMEEN